MLASLRNMFKVPDLRNKVLFTLLIIGVYLLGANIVVPGVNFAEIQTISAAEKSGGVLGFLNLFSGGALARAAIFGLGIMPYITSSIIVQLLQTVIPKFEQWREQGAVGQRKLTQATRYLTVALAVMQSSGLVFLFHSGRALRQRQQHRPDQGLHRSPGAVHHPRVHRRHGRGHVARRAHHPARHRQRDVDPDLLQRRRGDADLRRTGQGRQGLVRARGDHLRGSPAPGRHRLCRTGPAAHPGHIRETGPGTPHVRRPEHLHPAQGQPGRCYPDHLRELPVVHPRPAVERRALVVAAQLGAAQPAEPDRRLVHRLLRPVHRPFHLLLRACDLRPLPAGGHDP